MNKGINFLLDKYEVNKKVEIESANSVKIDGKSSPLLPWRWERRIIELKNLAQGTAASGALSGLSVMRSARIGIKGTSLKEMFIRETDICEFVCNSAVKEIFAVANGDAMNIIAKLESGVICTIELAATLKEGDEIIDKHEVISRGGVACDRVVDTQVPQSSVYLFGEAKEKYQDVDAELYGLSVDEAAIVRQSFDMAAKGYDLNAEAAHLESLWAACKKSVEEKINVIL